MVIGAVKYQAQRPVGAVECRERPAVNQLHFHAVAHPLAKAAGHDTEADYGCARSMRRQSRAHGNPDFAHVIDN